MLTFTNEAVPHASEDVDNSDVLLVGLGGERETQAHGNVDADVIASRRHIVSVSTGSVSNVVTGSMQIHPLPSTAPSSIRVHIIHPRNYSIVATQVTEITTEVEGSVAAGTRYVLCSYLASQGYVCHYRLTPYSHQYIHGCVVVGKVL